MSSVPGTRRLEIAARYVKLGPMNGVTPAIHPDLDWAASGAMALTGHPGAPPLLVPAAVAAATRDAIECLAATAEASPSLDASALHAIDPPALLGEHAALLGHTAGRGQTSVGGACHLLRTRDSWIAVNLARDEDVALLPAWLGTDHFAGIPAAATDSSIVRRQLARATSRASATLLVQRARELGMAVSMLEERAPRTALVSGDAAGIAGISDADAAGRAPPWLERPIEGDAAVSRTGPPLVLDFSALWAGPLCSHLLELAGAKVVKVESTARPDGARRGSAAFFDLLHGGKQSVALDFSTNDGLRALAALVARADIVIEGSRPRALRQLGVFAEELVAARPGIVWVSITGHGRADPMSGWVAFGDDAAVAGGLVAFGSPRHGDPDMPAFCGDAIADPLTGMHAAAAALAQWHSGRGALLDVALSRVAAHVAGRMPNFPRALVENVAAGDATPVWSVAHAHERVVVAPPRARPVRQRAAALGADTRNVFAELGVSC